MDNYLFIKNQGGADAPPIWHGMHVAYRKRPKSTTTFLKPKKCSTYLKYDKKKPLALSCQGVCPARKPDSSTKLNYSF